MKSNAFGLDIGTTSIKVVWLNRDNNTISYNTSLTVPTPIQGLQSESPFDHQEMAQVINKLVIEAKITTNNVNIALPENHAFTKVIEMPVLSDRELSNAIYWEAEQYIPVPLESVTLAWSKLRNFKGSLPEEKMQVLLVAAPKELIKRYQTILDLAGLSIASVETEILAVIRGLISAKNAPTSLIANIGAMSTSLAIVQNGILVFNYSVPLGGVALTRAIASDFGLQVEQAEEYKRVYGLSDKNFGGKVGKAIQPILTSLLTEVKKAITFYTEQYKNESPISQLLLTGGGASLPGLAVYFAQNLGIEAALANPWKLLNVQAVPPKIESVGQEYSVAVGLALKEYE
ncbi:MAG TPA: type IV pilus assembly protein PilM [Candidatus Saccharimonadales bacterium]|nr:type IV pilus assembly protein PilM [Candidatus Saccharimonadales bacterium]